MIAAREKKREAQADALAAAGRKAKEDASDVRPRKMLQT
jgi:hypothetical protein